MNIQRFIRFLDNFLLFIAFSLKSYYFVLTRVIGFGSYSGLAFNVRFADSPYGYAALFSLIMGVVFLLVVNNVIKDIYDFAQKKRMDLSDEKDLRKRLLPFDSASFISVAKRCLYLYAFFCAGLDTLLIFKVEGCVILGGLLYLVAVIFFGLVFLARVRKTAKSERGRERCVKAFIPSFAMLAIIAFCLMQLILFTAPTSADTVLNGWKSALITDACVVVITVGFFIGVGIGLHKKAEAEDTVPENLTISDSVDAFDEK